MISITECQTGSSTASSSIGGTGTDGFSGTTNYTNSDSSLNITQDTFSPSSYGREFTESRDYSSVREQNFTPSTQTEFSPGPPATTITITHNYTESEHYQSLDHKTTKSITDNTSSLASFARATGETIDGVVTPVNTTSTTTTQYSETFTGNGASTFIASFEQTVDEWTTKTVSTNTATGFTWENPTAWTTVSDSFTVSTNSTQSETSSSSWTLTHGVTENTTDTTDTITTPVTYAGDRTTVHASTVTTSNTSESGTFTVPVTNETVTGHAYAQKIDTVLLMHGGRGENDFNLGDMLWHFTLSALGDTASTVGRFTDLFASTGAATVTLSDYEKYRTNSIAISEIAFSQDTVTSTTSTITGTGTATGTASTGATVMVYSKGGAAWSEYETCTTTIVTGTGTATGTAATTGISLAASNTSTVNYTFSIGDVGTSLSTWTAGTETYSSTIFTHSIQVTGYDSSNISLTSTTETAHFASSSFSETRLALWHSTTTSMDIVLRSTTTDAALINSYSSYMVGTDTSYFFLGKVSTATTRVYSFATTTSQSLYDSHFNQEARNFTTVSSYSLAGGANGETSSVHEAINVTNFTKYRALPQLRTTPDGWDHYQFTGGIWESMDKARFSVLPYGYAGFGGAFDASTLAVKFTVEAGLLSGSAFSGQSFQFGPLPTVSAYPGVTLYPVDPALTFDMPGAARASYVTGLSSIGTASVAVTWTSTTTATTSSGTASQVTSRLATYTLAGVSAIGGTFFSEDNLSIHSEESFQLIGGYAVGDNNLGHPYTVFARSGFAQWTEYSAGQSTASASFSTSGSNGTVSFTVPGSKGIVFQIEPIFTANWTGAGEIPFYFSSTPHVRTP